MLLLIAIGIALIHAILSPFTDGLYKTSLWVAKILCPPEEETDMTKQVLKIYQAALLEGWPSNFPFVSSILSVSCIIIGFFYSWWGGFLAYTILALSSGLTRFFFTRSVSYYLLVLYNRMSNRTADYKRDNDTERAEAAEETCKELEEIIFTYKDSRLKPPGAKQLKAIPYGDLFYWLNHETKTS